MAAESFNHFAQISGALHTAIAEAVKKAAFDIQAGAAQHAAVDTGFMRSSIYVETAEESTYGQGVSGGGEQLPEIPRAENDTTAYIAVGATYGLYQEMGTVNMPAHPYLIPALEAVRAPFVAAMSRLEDALKGAGG